jgi:hypothetical protein
VLTVHQGAAQVQRDDEASKPDELWVAAARADGEATDTSIYLRLGPPRQMAAELICAVLGRALGLSIPEPFLVRIPPGMLQGSRLAAKAGEALLGVGSQHLGGGSFDQLLNEHGHGVLELLTHWPDLMAVAAFDGWLANNDRNLGNLVYARQKLWLIDHADALAGEMAQRFSWADLVDQPLTNKLVCIIERLFALDQRRSLLDDAARWLRFPAAALSLADAMQQVPLHTWHSPAERSQLLDFVRERFFHTHHILCSQLGHPQLPLQKR